MSNLKAAGIVAGLLAVAAAILLLVIPAFTGSEVPGKTPATNSAGLVTGTAVAVATTASPVPVTTAPAPSPSATPAFTPTTVPSPTSSPAPTTLLATATTAAVPVITLPSTPTPGSSIPAGLTAGTPSAINTEQPALQSSGARSCPKLTNDVLENVRNDYLAYWDALKKAHREVNAELVRPYIDPKARDGRVWQDEVDYVNNLAKAEAYVVYDEILHSDPLVIKIYPNSYNECFLDVLDATRVTTTARKKSDNQPYNDKQPIHYSYPQGHSFVMVQRNGRWTIAGEGLG